MNVCPALHLGSFVPRFILDLAMTRIQFFTWEDLLLFFIMLNLLWGLPSLYPAGKGDIFLVKSPPEHDANHWTASSREVKNACSWLYLHVTYMAAC